MPFGPWGADGLDSMFLAIASRQAADKDSFELHGVKMAPLLFGSMIIDATRVHAFRTLGILAGIDKLSIYRWFSTKFCVEPKTSINKDFSSNRWTSTTYHFRKFPIKCI
jgi:hypothetical protein